MTLTPPGMETIGQRLKNARIDRGLTIEEAAKATRIQAHYLQAIEDGDFSALPSVTQGRGFIRNYASFLGVDFQSPSQAATAAFPPTETTTAIRLQSGNSSPVSKENNQSPQTALESEPGRLTRIRRQPRKKAVSEIPSGTAPTSGSQTIFKEIGVILRQRRESLSLSLPDIEQHTRLRSHYLQALENGNTDGLPSPVQGRGMLNNYALFLNLDAEALLLKYADGLQARRIEHLGDQAPHHAEARPVAYPALRRILSLDLVIGLTLIFTLAVFLVWGISQVASVQNLQVTNSTLPPVSQVLAITSSSTLSTSVSGTAQAGTPSQNETGGVSLNATVEMTQLPTDAGPIQVYIIARQQAWVRVTVDGKVVFTGRMIPGNAYPFAGSNQVELLTGSAAALQVFYNKTDIGPLGLVGQVVDLVFNINGMVLPTATMTPTQTKTATITPTPAKSGTVILTPVVTSTPAVTISPTATR